MEGTLIDYQTASIGITSITGSSEAANTYYLALWGAAVLDTVLFLFMPEANVCYVCNAFHRNFNDEPRHPKFDREIEERLKFGEKAVMGKPMRPGGTAGAPEPEH